MKKILILLAAALFAADVMAQDEPTVNWPYLYPDFIEGESTLTGGKTVTAKYNIHLGLGALHFVNDGVIAESSVANILTIRMGDEVLLNVGGKMLPVLAKADGGYVVKETLADYSAIVRDDGAYGGSLSNAAKGFSYDENYGNYGYLVTNVYEDLLSIKNESEELPVTTKTYLYIDGKLIIASKKNVSSLPGVDKKAFSDYLKANKVDWKNPSHLVGVIDFVTRPQ
ncbi:MAG: hypothetical protein IKY48_02905 [Bacteroidales bacterium]|nr:hypothetical protein [Bacteroidales bacterium]